jgi:hypothetical protein
LTSVLLAVAVLQDYRLDLYAQNLLSSEFWRNQCFPNHPAWHAEPLLVWLQNTI